MMKPLPLAVLGLLLCMPAVLPDGALRRHACAALVLLVAMAAGAAAGYGLAAWWVPPVTDGHPVMPVGQLLVGAPLGATAFLVLAMVAGRRLGRRVVLEARLLAALGVLALVDLIRQLAV